jgi:hypothetical protein
MRQALLALAFPILLCACPFGGLGGQTPAVKAQEAAQDLNLNTRFGRMELAAESVDGSARESFFEHRKAWGGKIRVADYEIQGMKMAKENDAADVFVRIAWFRVDEGDLRVTTVQQKWKENNKGDWKLFSEQRTDGDIGVFGEGGGAPSDQKAKEGPKNAHFPTIRLGDGTMPNEELPSKQ